MKRYPLLVLATLLALASCRTADVRSSVRKTEKGIPVNMWAIDMTPFEHNGKWYAVWSGWDEYLEEQNAAGQQLYIAEMTFHKKYPKVRLGPRSLLTYPELPWEEAMHYPLTEGPTALKHNDEVFIIYSTQGSTTIHYKMGMIKLRDRKADPLDRESWIKKDEPVFSGVRDIDSLGYRVYGVGHASFTTSPDDNEHWIYYHSKTTHTGGWGDRKAFVQKFYFGPDGDPYFGVPADSTLPMARPSGEVEIELADGVKYPAVTFFNPFHEGADPWVTKHDGKYYTCRSFKGGIWVTESRFLSRFENYSKDYEESAVKVWTPPGLHSGKWNSIQVWAPEIHHINGKWYIFYAAGRQRGNPYWEQRAGVLISTTDSAFGPYEEHGPEPLFTGEIVYEADALIEK